MSRYDLVDNFDERSCCYRLFGQVVVTCYLYMFIARLMHLFMVQVEIHVGAWLMHLFMLHVDYRLFGQVNVTGYLYMFDAWLMHLFMVNIEVQVYVWYMLA